MECRTLNFTIISAENLKKVNLFSKMDVYVVVSLLDSTTTYNRYSQRTHVNKNGNKNPRWNSPIKFTVNDAALQSNRLTFQFRIFSQGCFSDSFIGEVCVPSSDLLASVWKADVTNVSYQVRRRSGKPGGVLNFSFNLSEKFTPTPPPPPQPPVATGYHAPPPYAYPAQTNDAGYAYPAPPPPPPNNNGYGYAAPQVVQPHRSNRFTPGMGLGAGLLGGALAGLVVGDLVSDIAHHDGGGYYDAGGYDDGGYDFGGFDF